MPALIFLKRKWLIACDDFVIPCTIESIIRVALCASLSIFTWKKSSDCKEFYGSAYFFYAAIADLMLTSILSSVTALLSARGSVLEVEKRRYLPKLLYIKIITLICDIIISSYGIWLLIHKERLCEIERNFVLIITVTGWLYCLVVTSGVIVCHDTLGSPKYWNVAVTTNPLNFFRKMQYIWRLRLKLFCCCADISEENDLIYVEISTFLASFLNGIDLVPTDILAGIITLSQKHVLERRKYMFKHMPESMSYLESTPVPDWMTVRNTMYFLRVSKSTYGWMAFFNIYQPWNLCLLSSHAKCNACCCVESDTKLDNCCYLNSAAVQKIAHFQESDILYASFRNNIHEPAFYVALNHDEKYVIVAIRGTRSFSDIVTDIDGETLPFPSENDHRFRCHRGVLRSAEFVQKRMEEHQVLESAFREHPQYTLCLAGHSLGGSVAAVLALLLRPRHPRLRCFAFGPMAAVSAAGVAATLDSVLTVVVGEDLAPRLCAGSCLDLREQITRSLRECHRPKYKILLQACWYHIQKYFTSSTQKTSSSGLENVVFSNDEHSNSQTEVIEDTKLYAPGRILYFERKKWNSPYWLTGLNLRNIIVNPHMIADHQPKKIQYYLTKYIESIADEPEVVTEQTMCGSDL